VLRVLHPRSFVDDPTRLLRLVRYGARLDFDPDTRTDAVARDAIAAGTMGTVSGPRVGAELLALCGEETAIAALNRASEMALTRALNPCFEPRLDLARDAVNYAGEGSEGADASAVLPKSRYATSKQDSPSARRDLIVLATSLTRCSERQLRAWLDEIGLTAPEREAVTAAALHAETLKERLQHAHRPSEVRHLVLGRPPEQLAVAAALGAAEPIERWHGEWSRVTLGVDGSDLIAAGVPEGPDVGRALEAAWSAALDDGVDDPEGRLAAALRAVRGE